MGIWRSRHILVVSLISCVSIPVTKLPAMALEQLKEYALTKLYPNPQGLLPLLDKIEREHNNHQQNQENLSPTNESKNNYGSIFEIETALNLLQLNQNIVAFNLNIEFLQDFSKEPQPALINECPIKLTSTEFDVITDALAIECKSTYHPQNQNINHIFLQIIKEHNIITWFSKLAKKIENDEIIYSIFEANRKNPYLGIANISTPETIIYIKSNWFNNLPPQTCNDKEILEALKQKFINLVQLLAKKRVYVFFKHKIPSSLTSKLDEVKIPYGNDIYALASINKEIHDSECE